MVAQKQDRQFVLDCLKGLNPLEGVDGTCYAKTAKLMHDDPLWRTMFLAMLNERKKDWVGNI